MFRVIGFSIRKFGQALDSIGTRLQTNPNLDRLVPSTRVIKYKSFTPKLDGVFLSSTATVSGRATIGLDSSVWYSAIIRADVNTITIGKRVSVGDGVMIHCAAEAGDFPTVIGDNVLIEPQAILHGCTIEDGAVVGAGSQVLDGAKIEKGGYLLPGSILLGKKTIPAGQVWGGLPAKYVRDVTPEEKAEFANFVEERLVMAGVHALESDKTWQEIDLDSYKNSTDPYVHPLHGDRRKIDFILHKTGELHGHDIPGRLFDSPVSGRSHVDPRLSNDIKL